MLAFWAIGDHHPPHSERESSTYVVRSNEKAPLHVRESAYTKSLWAYVWRMDRHRSESNERQSGVCTKSARRNPRPTFRRALQPTTQPRKPWKMVVGRADKEHKYNSTIHINYCDFWS